MPDAGPLPAWTSAAPLEMLFERFPDLALAEPGADPVRSQGLLMNAITKLMVRL